MTTETFAFSILAAVLGMSVVFLFLGILSFLMYAIKALFGEAGSRADADEACGRSGGDDWVIAAAAAFVLEEELSLKRTAAAWVPKAVRGDDPWHNLPRL